MSSKRGIQGRSEKPIWKQVADEIVRARKKAGKKVGDKVVRSRKSTLGNVSGRRKAGVRHVIGSDGTLVFLDHAPMALAAEEGDGTISAKGGLLPVGRAGQSLGKVGTKTPGAFTFKAKSGSIILARKAGQGDLEILATLVREIRFKRNARGQFQSLVEAALPEYIDEIEKNIIEGFK